MTKREHMPVGYDPTLDIRQPPPLGCLKIFLLLGVLLAALVPIGLGILWAQPKAPPPMPTLASFPTIDQALLITVTETELPTETPTATPSLTPSATNTLTPDFWGRTGTALVRFTATATYTPSSTPTATNTLIYCYWLTPSPTFTPTLAFTPDSWGRTGTAIYMATHPFQTPTLAPPRELCLDVPTWTPSPSANDATATWTPYPFVQRTSRTAVTPAQTTRPTVRPATATARVIEAPPVIITSPPIIVTSEVVREIIITMIPYTLVPLPTALPSYTPTLAFTPEMTQEIQPTNTATYTYTPTSTETATSSPTSTNTATYTYTPTPTETATVQP
jgi:hypothetical protein